MPAEGVYATWLHAGEEWLPAATSIGVRPTIASGGALTVEAHVLDFDGDLYGKHVRLAFARRLRAQRRFASEQALRDAIASDVQRVPDLLRHAAKPA